MTIPSKRELVRESLGSLDRYIRVKEKALARARRLYGDDVSHLGTASGTKDWVVYCMSRGYTSLFARTIKQSIKQRNLILSPSWKITIPSSCYDIIITISEDVVRLQFFGDPKLAVANFYKQMWHPARLERPLTFDFSVPTEDFVRAIQDNRFHRGMNAINSTALSPLDLF